MITGRLFNCSEPTYTVIYSRIILLGNNVQTFSTGIAFEHVGSPCQTAEQPLSGSVMFIRVIQNAEQWVRYNRIRAYCMGNTVCCKLHCDRREKSTEWRDTPSLLPLQFHVPYTNNIWKWTGSSKNLNCNR